MTRHISLSVGCFCSSTSWVYLLTPPRELQPRARKCIQWTSELKLPRDMMVSSCIMGKHSPFHFFCSSSRLHVCSWESWQKNWAGRAGIIITDANTGGQLTEWERERESEREREREGERKREGESGKRRLNRTSFDAVWRGTLFSFPQININQKKKNIWWRYSNCPKNKYIS